MLLAIDIGNTTISVGVFQGKRICQTYTLETVCPRRQMVVRLRKVLQSISRSNVPIQGIIICSVVPRALLVVESTVRREMKIRPWVVGRDIKVPIRNNYRNPRQVGQDRLVGVYAAKCLYGSPCLIIDFGTAITFDVVSRRGDYEGGMIIPGIRLSVESLFHKTALLPRVEKIIPPRSLIGKETKESILSGIFHGYGAMCSELIDRIAEEIRGQPKVILTGGHTDLIKKFIFRKIDKIDRHLVFKGMYLLSLPLFSDRPQKKSLDKN